MGGWDSLATQSTVITPGVVKLVLAGLEKFVEDFNHWAKLGDPVKLGFPTGSSAWHSVDDDNTTYGDVDVQFIIPVLPETCDLTNAQTHTYWNKMFDEFVKVSLLPYTHPESTAGHPIIYAGYGRWVQVDLMYHTKELAKWGRYRVTPERGTKGLLHGNIFSVLGSLLDMSIQHYGVQFKERNGERIKFRAFKDFELKTITTNIETFIQDIFDNEFHDITGHKPFEAVIDLSLMNNPGVNPDNIQIASLVAGVKGIASSFELNDMYGKGNLRGYEDAADFLAVFIREYETKAMKDVNSKKRDKAETTVAKARASADRDKVLTGLARVKEMFGAGVGEII